MERRDRRCAAGPGPLASITVAVATAAVLTACEIQEVTIPLGEEQVVVQGVLTLDSNAAAQYIVVERSLTGTAEIPDQDSLRGPPRPPLPISGALVVVTRDDGDSVRFFESATAGVYELPSSGALPFLEAGRVYRLRVRTPDGRTVSGRTRMPGVPVLRGMPEEGSTFNRDRDTVRIRWSGAAGTKGVFVEVRPRDIVRRLTFLLFTDSTEFRLPGNMPLPFLSDTLPPVVWIAGARQTFTVAAMDTNFFDHLRTRSDPFTGGGFLNRLEGGIGVFGAMAPVSRELEVRGVVDHPFEGRYLLRGTAGPDSLAGELELYVNRDRPEPVLVNGLFIWTSGLLAPRAEAAGWVQHGALHLHLVRDVPGEAVEQLRLLLAGPFTGSGSVTGDVGDSRGVRVGSYVLARMP